MNLNRLLSLREYEDLKQEDIATILKVNRVNISNLENNKEIIPLTKINEYANYFNTTFDYILGISNTKKSRNKKAYLDKKAIGIRLKEFRKNNKITQTELASILNTSHSTISAYENGKTLILTSFVYQIAIKYNVSMDWLCCKY